MVSWRTPNTYRKAGVKRGTATSKFHDARDNLRTSTRVTYWRGQYASGITRRARFRLGSGSGDAGQASPLGDGRSGPFAAAVTLYLMPSVDGGGTAEEAPTDGGTRRGASLLRGQHRPAASPI